MANLLEKPIDQPSSAQIVGAGRRAAEALAAANAGLNPRSATARADIALTVAEIADFLERNADALRELEGRAGDATRDALARNATQVCVQSILSVDQFAELDAGVVGALRDLYANFVERLTAVGRSLIQNSQPTRPEPMSHSVFSLKKK